MIIEELIARAKHRYRNELQALGVASGAFYGADYEDMPDDLDSVITLICINLLHVKSAETGNLVAITPDDVPEWMVIRTPHSLSIDEDLFWKVAKERGWPFQPARCSGYLLDNCV